MVMTRRRLINDPFSREQFPSSIYGEGCELYVPLGNKDMQGSTILSYNAVPLSMTVTGSPTWGRQGRTFNSAVPDFLRVGVSGWRASDSSGTFLVWYKTAAAAYLVGSCDEASATRLFGFGVNTGVVFVQQRDNDTPQDIVEGTFTNAIDNTWHLGAVTSNGSVFQLYADAVLLSKTATSGSDNGNWLAQTSARDNITLATMKTTSNLTPLTGIEGEVWYYSRELRLWEINQLYLETKWRYVP